MKFLLAAGLCVLVSLPVQAGNQKEERLAASVRDALHQAVSDAPPTIAIEDADERDRWLAEMSRRLEKRVPDPTARKELLITIHYEASRAGLDPQLVLGLIQIESRFRKYALSKSGARGYMQVMPFWIEAIGNREDNLFHMRTNLRYGCTVLRHYIDLENGDLFLALGRYNGSRGKSKYPNSVLHAWHNQWAWTPSQVAKTETPSPATPTPASAPPPAALPPVTVAPVKPPPTPPVPATPAPASPPAAPPPATAAPVKPPPTPPPATPPQIAAATLDPPPKPPRAEPAPPPASRPPVRRDIVIVR